jgi:hypothetical protein
MWPKKEEEECGMKNKSLRIARWLKYKNKK